MMSTYLGSDADDLDGFEFLTMAEAGEVGHWEILGKLNEKGRRGRDPRAGGVGAPNPGATPEGGAPGFAGDRGRRGSQRLKRRSSR